MEMMNHFSHEHHLVFKDEPVVDGRRIVCKGCNSSILEGQGVYECKECQNYILHKTCAELPREIVHPKHLTHPLVLFPLSAYPFTGFNCNICKKGLSGFTYRCSICDFDLDISCTKKDNYTIYAPDELRKHGEMQINHFLHDHPLVLTSTEPKYNFVCRVCSGTRYSKEEHVYVCRYCVKDINKLHKGCAELPREILHPRHYQHSLLLLPRPNSSIHCSGCRSKKFHVMYYCSHCEFALDVNCAAKDKYVICTSKDRHIKHKGHQHPLLLQPKEAVFLCDACGYEKRNQLYTCPSCPFIIHESCLSLPETSKFHAHDCDLTLAYAFPSQHKDFEYRCDICEEIIYDHYWLYYCGPCRFFVHINCVATRQIEVDLDEDANYEKNFLNILLDDYDNLVYLPAKDISKELIGRLLLEENNLAQIEPEINHFGHKQHPLKLLDKLLDDIDEDEEILCNGCVEPFSAGSYYCCVECSYFLHVSCAKLPITFHHSDHEHQLTLGCHEKFYDIFYCSKCMSYSNGFFYKCKECYHILDIKCAAMPTIIKHENHKHPLEKLEEFQIGDESCSGCGERIYSWQLVLNCKSCDYKLHYRCAMLPGVVRHRFDPHPYALRFPPYKYHPEGFTCDMCEDENMHPKYWLYLCSENKCDNSFHTKCVPRLEESYQNIKYGGSLEVSSHPHTLKFVRKPRVMSSCSHCEAYVKNDQVFECEDCKFCLCLPCFVRVEFGDIVEVSSHPHPLKSVNTISERCGHCKTHYDPKTITVFYKCQDCDVSLCHICIRTMS